jgi:hypothetical protein
VVSFADTKGFKNVVSVLEDEAYRRTRKAAALTANFPINAPRLKMDHQSVA